MKEKIRPVYVAVFLAISTIGCGWSVLFDDKCLFYFTFLSNVYCWFLMVLELVNLIRGKKAGDALVKAEFCGAFMIMVTGLVASFILDNLFVSAAYWTNMHGLIVHFIVPIMFPVYFFCFQPVERVKSKDVFLCIIPPYLYNAMIMVRQAVVGDGWYPYFFLDVAQIGVAGVARWVLALTAAFLLLGFLLLKIHAAFARRKKA